MYAHFYLDVCQKHYDRLKGAHNVQINDGGYDPYTDICDIDRCKGKAINKVRILADVKVARLAFDT